MVSAIVTGILYFPSEFYFLNDDFIHIPASARGNIFQNGFQRPVHELLLHLEFSLWGTRAWGFHLTRLIIHFLNAILVYRITKCLFIRYSSFSDTAANMAASSAASVFLLYAFHSEAVLWILGAGASLASLFILLSIHNFLKMDEQPVRYWFSIVFFILALFTYESSWVLPVIIGLLYYFDPVRNGNRTILNWKHLIFWFLFIANLIFRVTYLGKLVSEYEFPLHSFSYTGLLLNFNRLVARSLLPPMNNTIIFVCCYCLAAIFILWWIFRHWNRLKLNPLFALLLLCFFISLIPFLGLGIDTHDRESERFLYLASVFICMLFAYVILNSTTRRWLQCGYLILLLSFQIFFLLENAKDYRMAGIISASLFNSMRAVKNPGDQLRIPILPVEYNGVPLLRVGLREGVEWIAEKDSSILRVDSLVAIRPTLNVFSRFFVPSIKAEFVNERVEPRILQFNYDSSKLRLVTFP